MHFSNDGWLPGEGGTDDPNNSSDITDTTDAPESYDSRFA
jgi:hypothetical protein